MFKVIENLNEVESQTFPMYDLKEGQVAEVVTGVYTGHIVLCVEFASDRMFLSLNQGKPDTFGPKAAHLVRLLDKPITVQFSND